jgi:hypothetical protein
MSGRVTETDLDNIEAAALGRSRTGLPFGFEHAADTLRLVAEVRLLREAVRGLLTCSLPVDVSGRHMVEKAVAALNPPCQVETFPQ